MTTNAGFVGLGQPVEIGRIDEALRQAWREEAARATAASESLAARTNVLNLIVHGSSTAEIAHVSAAIARLGVQHPSRTILLLAEPRQAGSALEAWVNTNVQTLPGSDRRLLFEQVTIAARGEAALHLPGVVDPLLLPELPDFLWWLGEPPFSEAGFTRMVDIVDRLIIDSAAFDHIDVGLRELAEMTIIPNGVGISDFAWDRLRPWRELIAQFFDPPEYAASLGTIEEVIITYEPPGAGLASSGISEGILALGWACSRLGWLVGRRPTEEHPGAFRWQLNTSGRTVEVTLRPEHLDDGIVGLRAITISAGGGAPGSFRVYREDGANLATEVDVPGAPKLDRIMRATEPDENDLLLHALKQFGRDRTYDGALVFAAQLASGLGRRT